MELKYPVENSRFANTPPPPASKLSQADAPQDDDEKDLMEAIPYESAIGSLMYLVICRRIDIATSICSLSRFNVDLGRAHCEGVQHVHRYLKTTGGEGICYKRGASTKLWG